MTSSGWHGLVTQSSAPIRSPRTRWATRRPARAHDDGQPGQRRRRARSRYSQACGPEQREVDDDARRGASRPAARRGTALASTRCSQPRRSRRLVSTWRNPESPSMTATRSGAAGPATLAHRRAGRPCHRRTVSGDAYRHRGAAPAPESQVCSHVTSENLAPAEYTDWQAVASDSTARATRPRTRGTAR